VLATGLLILLLRDIFQRRSIALLGGALFAVQPAQVAAVGWIGGRTDSLSVVWMLLFAWTLTRAVRSGGTYPALYLLACVLFYALAVFTKEQMLPCLILVPLGFRCWAGRRSISAIAVSTMPFLGVAVAYGLAYHQLHISRPAVDLTLASIIGDTG